MDHEAALSGGLAEKYLLKELSEAERSEFEAHYFECPDCAADVRTTAAFVTAAKDVLRGHSTVKPKLPPARKRSWVEFLWQPAITAPAMAVLLGVVIYQNAIVLPRFTWQDVQVSRPEILSALSLIGANSRGAGMPSLKLAKDQPLLISFDVPTAAQYANYTCVLVAPTGARWQVPVPADQAQDTISIRVPGAMLGRGDYQLIVQGQSLGDAKLVDLATYRFTLTGAN